MSNLLLTARLVHNQHQGFSFLSGKSTIYHRAQSLLDRLLYMELYKINIYIIYILLTH